MLITKNNLNIINEILPVKQVVSLVPSITETIAYFGGASKLAGVTRFCKYPEGIREETNVVGGPKDFDVKKIFRLKPDVVVAVKEENDKKRILELAEQMPVVLFDITHAEDAFGMIQALGKLLNKEKEAARMLSDIKNTFNNLLTVKHKIKCVYLIWKKPWMAAGKETFINEMLQLAGFENIVEGRYPEIKENIFSQAEVLLLSSEPFPFIEVHRKELQQKFPHKKVLLVDGEMFSWYGSRMRIASHYFLELRQQFS